MYNGCFHRSLCFAICGLLLVASGGLRAASDPIEIELLPGEDAPRDSGFFHQSNVWAPVYTSFDQLQLKGRVNFGGMEFLLLSVNDRRFPIYVTEDHQFEKTIHLDPGENHIRVETNLRTLKPAEMEVVQVQAAEITGVVTEFEGGSDDVIPINQALLASPGPAAIQVRSPMIRITGILGTEGVVDLKVKDSYNNTLPVIPVGEHGFSVSYTLREKSSVLKLVSSLDNQIIRSDLLRLELQDMIEFDLNSPKNPIGWLLQGENHAFPVSQLDTVTIQGMLKSVDNGKVELIMGENTHAVPVKHHRFEVELPLELNQVNRGRVKVRINNQSFFESFQIDQIEPVIQIHSLKQEVLDGSFLLPEVLLNPDPAEPLRLRECNLSLTGRAQFIGELELVLQREPGGKVMQVAKASGDFDCRIPLEPGQFSYNLLLRGGGFARPYYSFDVEVQPAIKVEAVNHIPYRSGVIGLSKPELLLRGSVYSVKRGLMQMQLGNEMIPIPVLDGMFEMNRAVAIPSGCDQFELSIGSSSGDTRLRRTYTLEVQEPEGSEETHPESFTGASEDEITPESELEIEPAAESATDAGSQGSTGG